MAYQGVLDDVRTCLKGGLPERLPVFAMSQVFDAVQAGYTFEDLEADKAKLIDSAIRGIEDFDWDWGWAPIGDSATFEPLGFDYGPRQGGKGNNPYIVTSHLPATRETLRAMRIIDPETEGRMHYHLEAIQALKRRFEDTVCTIGWVVGPLQCAAYLYGVSGTFLLVYDDPGLLKDTLFFFVEQASAVVESEARAGADAIFVPDLLSASYFLSREQYREFVLPAHIRLFQHIDSLGLPVFFHPNEPRPEHLRVMAELTQVCELAITVGSEGNIVEAKRQLGNIVCLMGNVHCLEVLRNGGLDTVRAELEEIIDGASSKGGHILNTCATMSFDTPRENAVAMVQTARELGTGSQGLGAGVRTTRARNHH
jgi:uroporphyrinogen-III decarboxylase